MVGARLLVCRLRQGRGVEFAVASLRSCRFANRIWSSLAPRCGPHAHAGWSLRLGCECAEPCFGSCIACCRERGFGRLAGRSCRAGGGAACRGRFLRARWRGVGEFGDCGTAAGCDGFGGWDRGRGAGFSGGCGGFDALPGGSRGADIRDRGGAACAAEALPGCRFPAGHGGGGADIGRQVALHGDGGAHHGGEA